MEKDKEIKKEDFFPSILKILETDGKLYYMASSFSLQGLVAGKKMYGSASTEDILKSLNNSFPLFTNVGISSPLFST